MPLGGDYVEGHSRKRSVNDAFVEPSAIVQAVGFCGAFVMGDSLRTASSLAAEPGTTFADGDWRGDLAAWWKSRPGPPPPEAFHVSAALADLRQLRRIALAQWPNVSTALRTAITIAEDRLAHVTRVKREHEASRRKWQAERRAIDRRIAREAREATRPPSLEPSRRVVKRTAIRIERVARLWALALAWVERRAPGGRPVAGVGRRASYAARREDRARRSDVTRP